MILECFSKFISKGIFSVKNYDELSLSLVKKIIRYK